MPIEGMKRVFPDYRRSGTRFIQERLALNEQKILQGFLIFCRGTANEYKVSCRKSEILQVRDVIEKTFESWTLEDLRGFLAILNQDKRAVWTKKCILTTLQIFIKWHWVDWSSRFNNLQESRKLNRQLKPNNAQRYNESTLPTGEEIDAMIRRADSIRDKLYVSMAAEAGLPPIVHLGIRWKDLRIDSPHEGITTLEYFRTKNQDSFVFPFSSVVTYYLKQWAQEFPFPDRRADDYLFPSGQNRQRPMSSNTAWYMLKRLARRAGLKKNVYQYLLRHRTLSEAYTKVTEEVHRKLFGHVRGSVQTRTYSHSTKEKALQIALEKLHKVETVPKEQRNQYEKKLTELTQLFDNHRIDSMRRMSKMQKELIQFTKLHLLLIKEFPQIGRKLKRLMESQDHPQTLGEF